MREKDLSNNILNNYNNDNENNNINKSNLINNDTINSNFINRNENYINSMIKQNVNNITIKNFNTFLNTNTFNVTNFSNSINLNNIENQFVLSNNVLQGKKITNDQNLLKQIKSILKSHFLFNIMPENFINYICSNFYLYIFPINTIIYAEGDFGNFFFILIKGALKVFNKKKIPTNIKPFKCFGESALIENCKREDTITSIQIVHLLVLDGYIYREFLKKIADENYKDRFNFINALSYFKNLDSISKYNLSEKLTLVNFEAETKIISKNEMGNLMYFIKSGSVKCQIKKKDFAILNKNEYFGQNSILFDIARTMDVIAREKTVCYQISREDLRDIFGANYKNKILFSLFHSIIANHEIMKDIILNSFCEEIFDIFNLKIYKNNEKIVKKSHMIDEFEENEYDKNSQLIYKKRSNSQVINYNYDKNYSEKRIIIIIDGNIYDDSKKIIASRNDIIGYEIIYDKEKVLNENYIAKPDLISLECDIEEFSKKLEFLFEKNTNSFPKKTLSKNMNKQNNPVKLLNRISKIQKNYLFKNLSRKTLEKIVMKMYKLKFKNDDIIVSENSIGSSFYLIYKGKVKIVKNGKYIRHLEAGSCFGERALLAENNSTDNIRTATCIAVGKKIVCYVLNKEDFSLILNDDNTKNYLIKKLNLQDDGTSLSNLYYIKFLGNGKFGNVYLVHNNKNIYAIKTISRVMVNKQKSLAHYFINERRIMLSLDHPFIVQTVKTLKNNYFCFFLIEYIQGISLEDHLKQNKQNNNFYNFYEFLFYSASLILIIEYLHNKLIAHRDIKPNNIMIDSNGYMKIIDFGTSKILNDYTSTVIGTPHYIAPEILQGKGYSLSCDYWSVGVTLYEIYYGKFPFGNDAREILDIYKETLSNQVYFPKLKKEFIKESSKVNKLIEILLKKKVKERCCDSELLKKQKIFNDFDWDKLIDFKLTAPYIPNLNDNNNLSINHSSKNLFDSKIKKIDINDKEKIIKENQEKFEIFLEKENFKNSRMYESTNLNFDAYDEKWVNEF